MPGKSSRAPSTSIKQKLPQQIWIDQFILKGELRCSLLQSRHSRPQQRPTATDHVHRRRRFPTCSSSRSRLVWNADHGLWRVTTRNQLWENVFRPRVGADARSLGGVESARGRTRVDGDPVPIDDRRLGRRMARADISDDGRRCRPVHHLDEHHRRASRADRRPGLGRRERLRGGIRDDGPPGRGRGQPRTAGDVGRDKRDRTEHRGDRRQRGDVRRDVGTGRRGDVRLRRHFGGGRVGQGVQPATGDVESSGPGHAGLGGHAGKRRQHRERCAVAAAATDVNDPVVVEATHLAGLRGDECGHAASECVRPTPLLLVRRRRRSARNLPELQLLQRRLIGWVRQPRAHRPGDHQWLGRHQLVADQPATWRRLGARALPT